MGALESPEPEGRDTAFTVPADVDLDRVWIGVAGQVWRRHPGRGELLATRLLRSPGLARALLTTPSLLLPWFVATLVILCAGVAATYSTDQSAVALIAPALSAAGIAYAYGPGIDPAWELARSMAVNDRMVLLVRALGVFLLDTALGLAAMLISSAATGIVVGWLIPMTTVSALALAVATMTRSPNLGVLAGVGGWSAVLYMTQATTGSFADAVNLSAFTFFYLAIAALCAAIVLYATRMTRGTA